LKRAQPAKGDERAKAPPPWEVEKKKAQQAALNALKRARRSAEQTGVCLSEWEDEFLESVADRIKEHGRAFADPELGAPGMPLSAMQGRKLKEITKKAKGEDKDWPSRKRGARKPYPSRDINED